MRTRLLYAIAALAAAGSLETAALAQGAVSSTTGVTGTTAPTVRRPDTGFTVHNGVTYFLRNNRVNAVTPELIPKGQIMTDSGRLMADGPGIDGFTLEDGIVYHTRAGLRQRIDAPGFVPGGHIMTLDGALVTMPPGVIGFPGAQAVTIPGRGPAPATSAEPR